jgi:uncharacterized membrane protein
MGEPKRTRLIFLGFPDQAPAQAVVDVIMAGRESKAIVIEDMVLLHKEVGGKVTVEGMKSASHPSAARGVAVGGALGAVLAVISGPIGIGAVLGGAAIGGVTQALKEGGLENDDIDTVSRFMADGRTGLMIAIPLADAEAWDPFVAEHAEFAASDKQHRVDIVPGRTFERAIQEYAAQEEA